jgi:hypothetical protein
MQLPSETVFEAALGLSESERLALVSRLLETIPVEDFAFSLEDDKLAEELDRRFGDHTESIDWSDLKAEK